MAAPRTSITKLSIIFSLVASALIWLPLLNTLAANGPPDTADQLLFSTIFADIGILALIWLNWAVRRSK